MRSSAGPSSPPSREPLDAPHALLPGVRPGPERLIGTTGGAQQDRVVGGTVPSAKSWPRGWATPCACPGAVRRLDHGSDGVTVHTDGGAYRPTLSSPSRRRWRVASPTHRHLFAERDLPHPAPPHGYMIKAMLSYERPFWRDAGLNGQAASDEGPVAVTFDNSQPHSDKGILLGFFEGRHGVEWGGARPPPAGPPSSTAVRYFGPEAAHPTGYVERDWARRGVDPGLLRRPLPAGRLDPVRQGAAPAHRPDPLGPAPRPLPSGPGTDGAVESGERAACEVLDVSARGLLRRTRLRHPIRLSRLAALPPAVTHPGASRSRARRRRNSCLGKPGGHGVTS